jgi:hypothetical protein
MSAAARTQEIEIRKRVPHGTLVILQGIKMAGDHVVRNAVLDCMTMYHRITDA